MIRPSPRISVILLLTIYTPMIQTNQAQHQYSLLGYQINTPIGVAACSATSGDRIVELSKLFSIVVHKTIRGHKHLPHPSPNVVRVETYAQLTAEDVGEPIQAIPHGKRIPNIHDPSLANSLGNPSPGPEQATLEIKRARAALSSGQILIVSVFGDSAEDFAETAKLACAAGAHAIEANFSCPNLATRRRPLYGFPEEVKRIAGTIVAAIKPIPLVVKVGICPNQVELAKLLRAIDQSGARAVCGINSVPMQVQNKDGTPTFGEKRPLAGVSGGAIRNLALEFTRDARRIIDQDKLPLELIAVGGVTHPEHFDALRAAGANAALTATGAMLFPQYLADGWQARHQKAKW